ncbi:DNA polymerase III subunit delta [Ekhidna sp.]|jgi:DNA polymerase-3 subunit delta|uniref:DNA polymerase III subunit delta n=1 Tax=Ekhidna sp. TaxID=2608089 RepID=UPI0032EE3BF5
MASDYTQIIKDINSGSYAPVYFLQGEETFYIDDIINNIENNALEESQRSFNQVVLYGKDTTLTDVIGAARRYPMMGERQVVIVKEAQEMRDWKSEDKQTLVVNYLENPLPSTILVFGYKYKTVDKRTKFGKSIEKHSVFLNAKKLYDNQVPDWIRNYCKSQGVKIDDSAVMMLSENIGNNLQRLANEIQKLLLNVKKDDVVNSAIVQKYVGISKDYNIFELQKALSGLNKLKALKIANYFASNPSNNPLVLTIYSLFSYFSKLLLIHHADNKNEKALASLIGVNPFFVKEYMQAARNYPVGKVVKNIKYLHEADMQSKGIGYATKKEGPVLTELVYKLMN